MAGAGAYLAFRPAGIPIVRAADTDAAVPIAVVDERPVEVTIRVTGTTQAENFADVLGPRLQGSRGGFGRSASTNLISANANVSVRSTSGSSGGSSGSSFGSSGTVASTNSAASSSSSGNVSSSGSSGGSGGGGGGGGGGYGGGGGDFEMTLQSMAPAGTWVKKGDVIAQFDPESTQQRLEDYESSFAQTMTAYEAGLAALDVTKEARIQSEESARASLEQARLDLQAAPVLSAITAERRKLSVEEAEARYEQVLKESEVGRLNEESQVRAAELQVSQMKVELDRARQNMDKMTIRAPIDGMLVRLSVFRNGEFAQVAAGDSIRAGMAFMRVVDTSSMIVDANVNQLDIDKIRIGQRATVRFDAFPNLELPAKVYSIGTVANARQNRQEYITEVPIRLKLDEVDPRVIPDLTASADIVVQTASSAPVVPLQAVFPAEDGNGSSYVMVKRSDGGFEERPVELGVSNNLEAVVRSGLQAGEEVALARP
jgi:RND family efflux transporter MFP subunit